MAEEEEVFARLVVASWEVKGKPKLALACTRISQTYANRIVRRKRPYREGARLDDTGGDPTQWELEGLYHNGHDEPGLPELLYPAHLDAVCDALVVHETGTLTTPTRGARRCRLMTFRRVEDAGLRDAAVLTCTFEEDNEDDAKASSFKAPSARAVARSLAQDTTDGLEEAGSLGDAVSELNEAAAELEGLANAPGEFVSDIDAQVNACTHAVDRVGSAFSDASSAGAAEIAAILTDPQNSRAGRALTKLGDVAGRERARVGGVLGLRSVTYPSTVSIFDVARDVEQDATKLMGLNPSLAEDFLRIAAGRSIRVFAGP